MPGTMEKEQQGKPTLTEPAAIGKNGKFSRPIADELEPEVLEEPRSRKEIEALGAPETAAVPLSQLKSMVTKTVNASSKLVAEAAMNFDIAPTENSLELLHAAMELLKTDKILVIDDIINEAVENNPILNDPNFKHQYIHLIQQHAVNKTIEEAKTCNQEAYVLLDKTIELHKKHLATMKKQYSDGSITPQGMTADLADTPVNAPSRPPLSQAKTVATF